MSGDNDDTLDAMMDTVDAMMDRRLSNVVKYHDTLGTIDHIDVSTKDHRMTGPEIDGTPERVWLTLDHQPELRFQREVHSGENS